MAITGLEYKCLYADVGSNGRVNDFRIWNKSSLLQGIQGGSVKFPNHEKLSNGEITPCVFVGDDAFTLKIFMMKLFPQQGFTGGRRVYNYKHGRVQRILEIYLGFYLTDVEYFLPLLILNQNKSRT